MAHSPPRGRAPRNDALIAAAVLAVVVASATAQQQFDELRKRALPPFKDRTSAVALGDVDGDGDVDVVFGNEGQSRLLLDDGHGVYTDATATRMPAISVRTAAVALGDVDGDGDLDLVAGNGSQLYGDQNRLYLNDGTGTFTDVTAARLPADNDSTLDVVFGDVDGDGDLDIVLGTYGLYSPSQNRLYLNDGTGTFTDGTAGRMPVDQGATEAVALADVDGDGDLDLVIGNGGAIFASGQQNRLYLNDGTGSFTDVTAQALPSRLDYTSSVAVGDIDGDGDLDLVFGNHRHQYGQVNRLYLNDGNGSYTDATVLLLPFDLDSTQAVALGDVDGDGDLDLAIANRYSFGSGGVNRLYLNDGTGAYTDATAQLLPAAADFTEAVALGDVDGDGDLDLVWGNLGVPNPNPGQPRHGQQNRLFLNDGTGACADATAERMPPGRNFSLAVALGDVDGDGDLDAVVGNSGQNRLLLGEANSTFTDATAARMPADAHTSISVALGDVDADGDLDVVFGNTNQARNTLYLNDGTGTFTDATATRMPAISEFTRAVALGDVDADGDLDLVVGDSPKSRLHLNDGTGTFTDVTAARMPPGNDAASAIALGDVDGDGDLDIVLGRIFQPNRLYLNDGTGTFTDVTAARMPTRADATEAIALGDVDGDGDLDIYCANSATPQQNRLYVNDGTGTFTDLTAVLLPARNDYSRAVALGDVDGDGDLDIVVGNSLGGQQNRLDLNDGTGIFTEATATRMPIDGDDTYALALGDVDGDGDLDAVFANVIQNRVYFNLQGQLDTPLMLRSGRRYTLEAYLRHGPPSAIDAAFPFLSAGTARIPVPPFGTFGLDPALTVSLPPFVIPQPAGVGALSFVLPSVPGAVGVPLFSQVLLVPFPFLPQLSNVTGDAVIR